MSCPSTQSGEQIEPLRYLSRLEAEAIEKELLEDYKFGRQQLIEIWGHASAMAVTKPGFSVSFPIPDQTPSAVCWRQRNIWKTATSLANKAQIAPGTSRAESTSLDRPGVAQPSPTARENLLVIFFQQSMLGMGGVRGPIIVQPLRPAELVWSEQGRRHCLKVLRPIGDVLTGWRKPSRSFQEVLGKSLSTLGDWILGNYTAT
ncbi:yjeF N-terminal domain-containing protein 3 isoform X4 [Gopherus evgoodei]|uniref:yjeF N-terminal domain-containing protein 3 isoform X4 n=1 Tax=Gopherus evgoodei TaxID=1825980 RepID=UPI0011D02E03|nr:yjeF N-terminal domain-containing protein 3 isoform X4 [Gopherus evgoodei]